MPSVDPAHSASAKPLPVGTMISGRYELGEPIGRGGMAVVYAANDRMLKREVAVKLVHPEALDDPSTPTRVRREARAVGGLHHPHLITFHDVGEHEGRPYIVMERLRGRSLAEERDRCKRLDAVRAARIGAQIAGALVVAHAADIIHRDLKPDNVFLVDRGGGDFVKLLDFSVAKLPDAMTDGSITSNGAVFGTPAYMPPEQAVGDPVSAASDLYSLGAVLFEIIAGRPPFQAKNVIQLLTLQSSDVAPDLRSFEGDAPAEMAELVARMLERDPKRRPENAGKVETILSAVAERLEREGVAPPPLPVGRPRPRKRMPSAGVTQAGNQGGNDDPDGSGVHAPSAVYREVKLDGCVATSRTFRNTQPRALPVVRGPDPRAHRTDELRRTLAATPEAAADVASGRAPNPRMTQPIYPKDPNES